MAVPTVKQCAGPIWSVDDITRCYRHRYFQELPFALACSVSLVVLLITVLPKLRKWKNNLNKDPAYRPLLADDSSASTLGQGEEEPDSQANEFNNQDSHDYIRQTRTYGSIFHQNELETPDPTDIVESESTVKDGKSQVILATVVRSTAERVRVALEAIAVAAQTSLSIAAIYVPAINNEWAEDSPNTPYVFLVFWVYCLLLVLIRLRFVGSLKVPSGGLWYHSTTLYAIIFLVSTISFRSAILHPFTRVSRNFYVAEWVLSLMLFYLNFSAKTGDKPPRLYIRDGIKPSNEPVSSLFQLISFSFVDSLVWEGYQKPLKLADVWELREDDHALPVLKKFRKIKRQSGMALRMILHFKKELFLAGCYALVFSVTIFGPAMLVKLILDYVENPTAPIGVAWMYAGSILVFGVVDNIANGQALFIGRRICIRMRAIIIGEVYAKALRRKVATGGDGRGLGDKDKKDKKKEGEEEGQANVGAIINLMAIDAFKVSEICAYLHFFVGGILQIIFAICLLYYVLDWSAFVGGSVMVLMMPANYKFSRTFARFQNELMKATDKRVEKTNELLQCIRIIKYFGWEKKFADGVQEVRQEELNVLRKRYYLWAVGALIWLGTPLCVSIFSFVSYTMVQGKTLTSPVAFTAMTLFNIMRVPMDQIADMLSNVLQSKVSIDRIDEFLSEPETAKYKQLGKHNVRGPNSPYIGFENASFAWNSGKNTNSYNFKLMDLNVSFPVGQMTVIVGPTGSGKTSMLMALLGEMDQEEGRVFLPGSEAREDVKADPVTGLAETVAYCSQQPWLLNDTMRNNILFGSEYDEERYNEVIEACQLKRDLEILEAGDQTEIGEKGITLSGGQKQRVSLARAMYSNSKHLLLDDCLSAVDSHTALAIYEKCLSGHITESRTIILVSHNVALTISQAARVVVVENGRVKAQGTPGEVVSTGALGNDELVKNSASRSASASQSATRVSSSSNLLDLDKKKTKSLGKEVAKRLADKKERQAISVKSGSVSPSEEANQAAAPAPPKLVGEETMSTGFVDPKVYTEYMSAMGNRWFWGAVLALFLLQQIANVMQSWWIREWTVKGMVEHSYASVMYAFAKPSSGARANIYVGSHTTADPDDDVKFKHSTVFYLAIYFAIGMFNMLSATLREISVFIGGLHASRKMFNDLLGSMLKAKIRFFDSTPIGRIMNRFSKDMEGVDQDMAPVFVGFAHCFLTCISTAVLIIYITPGFAVAAVFIFAMYTAIGIFYLAGSRELKRIDSVYKSPIYQHFGETLVGVSTIRAYGDQRRFIRDNLQKIDDNNRPFFYLWVTNRWLSFRVDTTGAFVSFSAAAFVLLSLGKIDSGLAGLSLSYALVFNEVALWCVRLYAVVEINLNSVERLLEYTNTEEEAPHEIEGIKPPPNWPTRGEIDFKNLSMRYAPELPLVIKDVSFKVEPYNKIGIVGRTGAGKSTIISSLFRFVEADSGTITIDGVDINTLGLRDLRQALAIIPQDPTLFVGSIRSNLDPFNQYTDKEIFEALRRVHLVSEVPSVDANATAASSAASTASENANQFLNLNTTVTEGGTNLSQGQRQLMCLARSLLKAPRVLLLDEATASIDYDTDARIQRTIRQEFTGTTLLTIAHRLRSIIDYDKILVLDHGEVVEYNDPHTLLSNTSSSFYDMCAKSGELDALLALAEESYKTKNASS